MSNVRWVNPGGRWSRYWLKKLSPMIRCFNEEGKWSIGSSKALRCRHCKDRGRLSIGIFAPTRRETSEDGRLSREDEHNAIDKWVRELGRWSSETVTGALMWRCWRDSGRWSKQIFWLNWVSTTRWVRAGGRWSRGWFLMSILIYSVVREAGRSSSGQK